MKNNIVINNRKRNLYVGIIATCMISLLIMIFACTLKTDAKENNNIDKEKFYTTISIKGGDSLWSIAEEYNTVKYETTKEYIKNIKKINNLSSDDIHSGNNIIVYYYND